MSSQVKLNAGAHMDSAGSFRTVAERVRETIRDDLLTGRFSPGERLGQAALAKRYGSSRIPVREALRQLASEGLIVIEPHVGARVVRLDQRELDEVYQMRELIEPFLIVRSAPLLSSVEISSLHGLVHEIDAAATAEDIGRWVELDRAFHLATLARAELPRLRSLIEVLWDTTQQYRRLYGLLPRRLGMAGLEHRLLLDALERRDPEDAHRVLTMHIRRTRLTLDQHVELFE